MNIVSKRTLIFNLLSNLQAKTPLEIWHQDVKKAQWQTPSDIKKIYANAFF